MSLCIRYVNEDLIVYERFIEFIDVSSERGAENLTKVIINSIKQNNLHEIPLIAQSYDGAGVMSGSLSGVQTRVRKLYPEAVYIHCLAHKLNFVVCSTCNDIKVFSNTIFNYKTCSLLKYKC